MVDLGRKMTLKQARERALEVAKAARDERCRLDHQQLADWLSELEQKDAEIARLRVVLAVHGRALEILEEGIEEWHRETGHNPTAAWAIEQARSEEEQMSR